MGSDQSSLPAGAPGSILKSQRDEDIPYTSYSISKPIDGESPRASPKVNKNKLPPRDPKEQSTPKHEIVVVTEGTTVDRDADPELVKLNAIPAFLPIMRGSLNIPTSTREADILDKLDHRQVLLLCLRYQDHLKQLSEAVAFDQNALCIRIKEIDCAIQMLMNLMTERQKKYAKCAEQFQKVTETSSALNRIKMNIQQIVPLMERLNQVLPPGDQLEPFSFQPPKT